MRGYYALIGLRMKLRALSKIILNGIILRAMGGKVLPEVGRNHATAVMAAQHHLIGYGSLISTPRMSGRGSGTHLLRDYSSH